ncbi:MAG: mRNA surveillance protein pelota [Candidatus Marsarchaeota archaeon]|nr:mRNA surveillance protein pelota [Candidatus Marsarchaeota archaeon]
MKILGFNAVSNRLRLVPESFEDLYLLARIIASGDRIGARSYRRFKSTEDDEGEQKEVFIVIEVEKVEIDRGAGRLRLTGKIAEGRPEEYVRLRAYHTLNIGATEEMEITKQEWKDYILKRIRQAVEEAKRPRLGIIVLDDEKALAAYVRGYGIDIVAEIYSKLSKKMSEKEFEKQRNKYFDEVIAEASGMEIEIVIIAGPGFTKDDIALYMKDRGIATGKKVVYAQASDTERSGIREVTQSETVSKILENEHVKKEFGYLNAFFTSLRLGRGIKGNDEVYRALSEYRLGVVMVNDSMINREEIKRTLDLADRSNVKIEIFNEEDEAGKQLGSFGGIAGIEKGAA